MPTDEEIEQAVEITAEIARAAVEAFKESDEMKAIIEAEIDLYEMHRVIDRAKADYEALRLRAEKREQASICESP